MDKIVLSLPDKSVSLNELETTLLLIKGLTATTTGYTHSLFEALESEIEKRAELLEDGEELILESPENVAALFRSQYSTAPSVSHIMRYRKAFISRSKTTVGYYTIAAGSTIPYPSSSVSASVKKAYKQAVDDKMLDTATNRLIVDLEVASASLAASLVNGYQTSGTKMLAPILWP